MPTSIVAALLLLLTTAAGEPSHPRTDPAEETRGPLKASMTVTRPGGPGTDVILRITLQNLSDRRQTLFLERPGAMFYVKDPSSWIVHATPPCTSFWSCDEELEHVATIEPGARMEFVEHWRPHGRCVDPGPYTVKAKLFAYQEKRPPDTVDAGAFVPFILRTDLNVRRDDELGRCEGGPVAVAAAPPVPAPAPPSIPGCPVGGGKLAPIFFALDQAALTPEARARVAEAANCIQQRGFTKVVVEGNTDDRGTWDRNDDLARRRAEAVRDHLVELGVGAMFVATESLGDWRPVCWEQTEDCWQRNRRVDILVE